MPPLLDYLKIYKGYLEEETVFIFQPIVTSNSIILLLVEKNTAMREVTLNELASNMPLNSGG